MEFEIVIGLEVHAQLKTRTKIFCGCSTEFGAPPNTHVCPVCLGMPGMLPVLNQKVVSFAIKMGLATHCTISHESIFARKNYFYPDLPKGYQISQYELPIATRGYIDIDCDGTEKRIGIHRIHMEEDAGKLIHDPNRPVSRVDYNRTGVPLIEIVSEPDLRSPEEAGAYLRQLRSLVRYLDICDGNMEEGSFRCDANISIRPHGSDEMGIRTEVKNLNSFKHVEKAMYYESVRQKEVLADGGRIIQETRLWDPEKNRTFSMRGKEEAHDYRYFPDPDLLPLKVSEEYIAQIREELPELPVEKKARFLREYGLPVYDAIFLSSSREMACYFEDCVRHHSEPKSISNWIMGPLAALLNAEGKTIDASPICAHDLAQLLSLIEEGVISGKMAKAVFEEMAKTGSPPKKIIEKKGLVQVKDTNAIELAIEKVIAENPTEVEAYRNGKTKLIGFFVGRIMRETGGKANPKIVNDILLQKLNLT